VTSLRSPISKVSTETTRVSLVLGTGKRLFAETSDKRSLRLKDSKVLGDGILLVVYERAATE